MPITDLLDRVSDSATGRPVVTTLAGSKAIGAASITVAVATNWTTTTALHFAIYNTTTVNGVAVKDTSTQTDWKGTLSGTTMSNLTITGGTDREYSVGAIVEITPTARFAKDLYDWAIVQHKQDGTHANTITTNTVNENTPANGVTIDGLNIKDNNIQAFRYDATPVISNPYKFSAYRAAAQSPANSVIQYDTENFDTNNNFDITTNKGRYTVPVSGFYQINAISSQNVTTAPQDPTITLIKNGASPLAFDHFVNMYTNASSGSVSISVLVQLTAGDYIEVYGSSLPLEVTNPSKNVFSGFLVSRT